MHERGDDLTVFHGRPPGPQRIGGRYGSGIEEAFCYVTTTGRRTGRPHRVEIWFAGEAGARTIYILTGERTDWVRNLLAQPRVKVRIGDQEGEATGRVVEPGSEEDALARRLLLAKYQRRGADDLESWGRSALPVALDLTFAP